MSLLRQQYIVIIQCEAPAAEMVSIVRQRDMSLAELCLYSGPTFSFSSFFSTFLASQDALEVMRVTY